MSEYEKLKKSGMGRGRPRHTPEQRERARVLNIVRQEARRRAHLVLKDRHALEFEEIYAAELAELTAESGKPRKQQGKRSLKA